MHKGRSYPWHWVYWATECFFFPGYVPWQTMLGYIDPSISPWNLMNSVIPAISQPGIMVPDATQIFWRINGAISLPTVYLEVSIEQELLAGQLWAVWKAILYVSGIDVAEAYYFQPSPCYSWGTGLSPWWLAHDPLSAQNGPVLFFSPALWTEITSQPHQ